jgi:hypothetical protein
MQLVRGLKCWAVSSEVQLVDDEMYVQVIAAA